VKKVTKEKPAKKAKPIVKVKKKHVSIIDMSNPINDKLADLQAGKPVETKEVQEVKEVPVVEDKKVIVPIFEEIERENIDNVTTILSAKKILSAGLIVKTEVISNDTIAISTIFIQNAMIATVDGKKQIIR